MPATLTASSLQRTGHTHNSPIQLAPLLAESALGMDSTDLLQGRKCVTILHNGMPYRLQATKLGKLILTK